MRRLQLTAFGDAADVVRLDSAPAPSLATDDLLVQMEAAPMNRSDFMLVEGKYGVRPELPYNLGSEGVGHVIGTGRAASALDGKRVLILPTYEQGTWAEQTVVSSRNVVEVSASLCLKRWIMPKPAMHQSWPRSLAMPRMGTPSTPMPLQRMAAGSAALWSLPWLTPESPHQTSLT